jgi:hypothetical protein
MNRPTSRRRISALLEIAAVLLLVSACAEHSSPLAPSGDATRAVGGVAQPVSWTGDGAPGGFCSTVATSATRTWTFQLTTPISATSTLAASFREGDRAVPATLIAFVSNNVVLTAHAPGPSGNLISASISEPGIPNSPLTVAWVGPQLSVTLATDGAGRVNSTAAQVVAAVNANPSSVVTATLAAGSDGSGIAQPLAESNLTGGEAGTAALAVTFSDDVRFTANTSGAAGNAVSVVITVGSGPNLPLTVSVLGNQQIVTLGTDAAGVATTTASQLVAAINAHPSSPVAAALLTGNDGSGLASPLAQTNLSGGGVEAVINAYQVAGVKKGGGRSPFEYVVTTIADAQLLSAVASGGDRTSGLSVSRCE